MRGIAPPTTFRSRPERGAWLEEARLPDEVEAICVRGRTRDPACLRHSDTLVFSQTRGCISESRQIGCSGTGRPKSATATSVPVGHAGTASFRPNLSNEIRFGQCRTRFGRFRCEVRWSNLVLVEIGPKLANCRPTWCQCWSKPVSATCRTSSTCIRPKSGESDWECPELGKKRPRSCTALCSGALIEQHSVCPCRLRRHHAGSWALGCAGRMLVELVGRGLLHFGPSCTFAPRRRLDPTSGVEERGSLHFHRRQGRPRMSPSARGVLKKGSTEVRQALPGAL